MTDSAFPMIVIMKQMLMKIVSAFMRCKMDLPTVQSLILIQTKNGHILLLNLKFSLHLAMSPRINFKRFQSATFPALAMLGLM